MYAISVLRHTGNQRIPHASAQVNFGSFTLPQYGECKTSHYSHDLFSQVDSPIGYIHLQPNRLLSTCWLSIISSIHKTSHSVCMNKLSQFMDHPTQDHWKATKRILWYSAVTTTSGIFLSANTPLVFQAYIDVEWAWVSGDYVSMITYIFLSWQEPGFMVCEEANKGVWLFERGWVSLNLKDNIWSTVRYAMC